MAKQTFTTGQVLTAAQMTSLQQTAMLGGAASAKVASYTLVAADAGTAVSMSNASATTITVNTGLFAEGDTVQITNLGAGVCTITAGTATVNTASSLALAQYESGTLDFISASAAVFIKGAGAAAGGGGKVLQVVYGSSNTSTSIASTTYADTTLSATITPSAATSKVLVLISQSFQAERGAVSIELGGAIRLLRGATTVYSAAPSSNSSLYLAMVTPASNETWAFSHFQSLNYLDSPATTSATTYKTQGRSFSASGGGAARFQDGSNVSTIILMEIGA
jgi:hypothetical protein